MNEERRPEIQPTGPVDDQRLYGFEGAVRAFGSTLDSTLDALREAASVGIEVNREAADDLLNREDDGPLTPPGLHYSAAVTEKALRPVHSALCSTNIVAVFEAAWTTLADDLGRVSNADRKMGSRAERRLVATLEVIARHHFFGVTSATHRLERGARAWWRALASGSHDAPALLEEALTPFTTMRPSTVTEDVDALLEGTKQQLQNDTSGRRRGRGGRRSALPSWSSVVTRHRRWAPWFDQACDRIALEVQLARFRAGLYGHSRHQIDSLRQAVDPVSDLLREVSAELEEDARRWRERMDGRAGKEAVARAEVERAVACADEIEERLGVALRELTQGPSAPEEVGTRLAEVVAKHVGRQPETFTVHRVTESSRPELGQPVTTFEFQRVAAQCMDALAVERLRQAVAPFGHTVAEVRTQAEEVPAIVRSTLTVFDQIVEHAEEEDGTEAEDVASMVPETLLRASELSRVLAKDLTEGLAPVEAAAAKQIDAACQLLLSRGKVNAGVSEHFAVMRLDIGVALRQASDRTLRWVRTETRRGWTAVSKRVRGLLRFSQEFGSSADASTAEATREIRDILVQGGTGSDALPLIYRQLFTVRPLREPSLVIARSDVVARILAAGMSKDTRPPLLLVATPSGGVSTIFNLASTDRVESRLVRVSADRRMTSETEVISLLAGADDVGGGLQDVPTLIEKRVDGDERPIVLLEGLEHLFLRRPTGAELVDRVLTVMRNSADRITWVASTSRAMWQVYVTASPMGAAGVEVMEVADLDRDQLETALWQRHQRSGIPLDWIPPRDAGPLLRRRLRRARNTEIRSGILRKEYFDRLHRATKGSLPLAIAMWLEGVRLSSNERGLQLRFPPAADTTFLDRLAPTDAFALKAFLEHRTLSPDELATVLHMPVDNAERVLRRLESHQVLDRVSPAETLEAIRFRVRPVAIPLVVRSLENRNVLHT